MDLTCFIILIKATDMGIKVPVLGEGLTAVRHVTYLWSSDIRQVGWSRIKNYCKVTIDSFSVKILLLAPCFCYETIRDRSQITSATDVFFLF